MDNNSFDPASTNPPVSDQPSPVPPEPVSQPADIPQPTEQPMEQSIEQSASEPQIMAPPMEQPTPESQPMEQPAPEFQPTEQSIPETQSTRSMDQPMDQSMTQPASDAQSFTDSTIPPATDQAPAAPQFGTQPMEQPAMPDSANTMPTESYPNISMSSNSQAPVASKKQIPVLKIVLIAVGAVVAIGLIIFAIFFLPLLFKKPITGDEFKSKAESAGWEVNKNGNQSYTASKGSSYCMVAFAEGNQINSRWDEFKEMYDREKKAADEIGESYSSSSISFGGYGKYTITESAGNALIATKINDTIMFGLSSDETCEKDFTKLMSDLGYN